MKRLDKNKISCGYFDPSCANGSAPPPQNGSEAAGTNRGLCISSRLAHLVGAEVQRQSHPG